MSEPLILVVEDDNVVAHHLKLCLKVMGHSVIDVCSYGEDAVEKARELKPDLILMDVIMPRKNGRELFADIMRLKPDMKVIFTSGYTADVFPNGYPCRDEMHFLAKPIIPRELLKYVRRVLDEEARGAGLPRQKARD